MHQKLVVPVDAWCLTLHDYTISGPEADSEWTQIICRYRSEQRLEFQIYKAGLGSRLARILGAQDISTGDPEFDHEFKVKGSPEEMVRRLFSSRHLRDLASRSLRVTHHRHWAVGSGGYSSDRGWGHLESKVVAGMLNELSFTYGGDIESPTLLLQLHELFAVTLKQLEKIGCVVPGGDPDLE